MTFIFCFNNAVYHIDLFVDLYHTSGINLSWSWCVILLKYYWILFMKFCWEFLIYSSETLTHNFFFFLYVVAVWFWNQGSGDILESIWEYSLVSTFGISLRKIDIKHSISIHLAKLPWEGIQSWTLILGIVLIADSVSILIIDLFRLPAYSWFSLRRLCISRNSTTSFRFSSF